MQIHISFRSRSDLVLDADYALDFSYLVLQAGISFCSVSDKTGASLFLPSSHRNAAAHTVSNTRLSGEAGESFTRKRWQKFLVMQFQEMWRIFWWQNVCQKKFPEKNGLEVVTKNFTAFFTASKEICHLGFTLGAFSHKKVGCHKLRCENSEVEIWPPNLTLSNHLLKLTSCTRPRTANCRPRICRRLASRRHSPIHLSNGGRWSTFVSATTAYPLK